jgi:uncharacterized protein (UPF0332 family)
MILISDKDCFDKGLLKKTVKQLDLAKKDIKQAEFFLSETEDLIELNKEHMASISLYNAFFHLARSLLFKDGIKERSHYCIARYIEKNYNLVKFVDAFETIMSLRHNVQYSTEQIEIDINLIDFCNICEKYIKIIGDLLNEN